MADQQKITAELTELKQELESVHQEKVTLSKDLGDARLVTAGKCLSRLCILIDKTGNIISVFF